MKSRPHSLPVDEGPSSNGNDQGNITKPRNYGGAAKSFSKRSINSSSVIDSGKNNSQFANLKRGDGVSDTNLKRPDHIVTTANSEKVPSKTIDNKTSRNTSSSESGSFNATDYKGERTYF